MEVSCTTVSGLWSMGRGPCALVNVLWSMCSSPWSSAAGMVSTNRPLSAGQWSVVYALWSMVSGMVSATRPLAIWSLLPGHRQYGPPPCYRSSSAGQQQNNHGRLIQRLTPLDVSFQSNHRVLMAGHLVSPRWVSDSLVSSLVSDSLVSDSRALALVLISVNQYNHPAAPRS